MRLIIIIIMLCVIIGYLKNADKSFKEINFKISRLITAQDALVKLSIEKEMMQDKKK